MFSDSIFFCLLTASADDISDLRDAAVKNLPNALDHLPSGTLDSLPAGFNASNIPSIEEGEEMLKEKCDRNGNNESYDNAMVSVLIWVYQYIGRARVCVCVLILNL